MTTALQTIEADIYGLRETFSASLADPTLKFEAEAGFALQSLMASDYAMKIAMSNRQSVINAVTNIAAIGISLNPAKKQAYLVPRDGKICLDISYMGLMELAIASGSILWAQAHIVFEKDVFRPVGYDKPPHHEYEPFAKDRGDAIGVYVVAKTKDGDYLTTCMELSEVWDIRDRSSAWKAWVKDKKKCPWVTDPGEMMKKTVIKRASKTWPKTDRLDQAIHHLNTDAGEGLADVGAQQPTDARAEWVGKVERAQTQGELVELRKLGTVAFQATRDRDGYRQFMAAGVKRTKELSAGVPA